MWQANWLFSGIKGDGMKKTVKTVKKEYAIWIFVLLVFVFYLRSEERRVGKECRFLWSRRQ